MRLRVMSLTTVAVRSRPAVVTDALVHVHTVLALAVLTRVRLALVDVCDKNNKQNTFE